MWCKLGVSKERLNAFNDVADVYIEGFTSNDNLLMPKLGSCVGDLLIDNPVELTRVGI